jgi:Ala-tRNA(Pro) deacylase
MAPGRGSVIVLEPTIEGGVMSSMTQHARVEPGDVVEVSRRRLGESPRLGEVLEVIGRPNPRYRVRWEDGHESILYPGETTTIRERPRSTRAASPPRLPAPTELLVDMLRDAGLEFEVLPHRRTTTAAAEARALGVLPQTAAKTVIARDAEGVHIRAVVAASSHVSLSKLATAVSASSVALLTEPELVSDYPQFELGAVPPFSGPGGDLVVVDRALTEQDHLVFDGGVHDTALRMRTAALIAVSNAQIADIASD